MRFVQINNGILQRIDKVNKYGNDMSWTELAHHRNMIQCEWDRLYKMSHLTQVEPEQHEIYNEWLPRLEEILNKIENLMANKRVDEYHNSKGMMFSDLTRRIKMLTINNIPLK